MIHFDVPSIEARASMAAQRAAVFYGKRTRPTGDALLLPITSPGSVGDSAMALGLCEGVKRHGRTTDMLDLWSSSATWADELPEIRTIALRSIRRAKLNPMVGRIGKYTDFYVMGADGLDGRYDPKKISYYVDLMVAADAMGTKTCVLGSSFSENPDERTVNALKQLPESIRINARDARSQRRMTSFLDREIHLTADVALLVEPKTSQYTDQIAARIQDIRSSNRYVVGLNISRHALEGADDPNNIIEHMGQSLSSLADKKRIAYVLMPHDYRDHDGESDSALLRTFAATCDRTVDILALPNVRRADEVKQIVGYCDLTVTGRMHLAIASLGANVPSLSLSYADKFEGLYEHFNLVPGQMSVSITHRDDVDRLCTLIDSTLSDLSARVDLVRHMLPEVRALARQNVSTTAA